MKLRHLFILVLLLPVLVGFSIGTGYLISSGKASFTNQVEDYLNSIIDVNEERLGDFISEIENDVSFLSKSEKVRDILNSDTEESETAAIIDVEGEVDVIVREVENYLLEHPDMTLKDLQTSDEFYDIAVQAVGEKGYSAIIDARDMTIYLHYSQEMTGLTREDILKNSKEVEKIISDTADSGYEKGFYNWTDIDGKRRYKYIEVKPIEVRTADGVSLFSIVTAYVDDYLVAKNISEELNDYFEEFILKRKYYNILFQSSEEILIYMTKPSVGLGVTSKAINNKVIMVDSHNGDLGLGETEFHGPFSFHGESNLYVVAGLNVYSGEKILGKVFLLKDIEDIGDIFSKGYGKAENYLVNSDAMLLTPLKSRDVDLLTQEIKTESVEKCLSHLTQSEEFGISLEEIRNESDDVPLSYLDFKGDLTFGLHRHIANIDWCLISEINADDVLAKPMKMGLWRQILFRGGIVLLLVFLTLVGSFFIDRRDVLRWKSEAELRKNSLNRMFCFLERSWMGNVNLFWSIFIGIILSSLYFFVTMKFFDVSRESIVMVLPYFVIFIISVSIFFYGFRTEKSIRKFLFLGSVCVILSQLTRVLLVQHWITIDQFSSLYWIPSIIFNAAGFIFLLIFTRRQND